MSHHTSASARAEHLHIGRSDLIPFDPFRLVQVPNVGVHNPMSCAGNLDRLKGRMGSLTLRPREVYGAAPMVSSETILCGVKVPWYYLRRVSEKHQTQQSGQRTPRAHSQLPGYPHEEPKRRSPQQNQRRTSWSDSMAWGKRALVHLHCFIGSILP